MEIDFILLLLLLITAVSAVMLRGLIRGAIALGATSVVVTLLLYRLGAPLAAVFELSVCAGIITVVFMSAISLTKPRTPEELDTRAKERLKRFWYLPVILLVAGVVLAWKLVPAAPPQFVPETQDVRHVLWTLRQLDLFGQIVIIIAGVFGVVVLFKDKPKSDTEI